MAKKSSFICPFCFEQSKLSAAEFRCTNRRCTEIDDIPMTKYLGGDTSMPEKGRMCFKSPSTNPFLVPSAASCPSCKQSTRKVVCPACHNSLPESTLSGKDMIISVVGSRDAGKSLFVGVLINELIKRIAVKFEGSMVGFDDSYKRYTDNHHRSLYIDRRLMEQTTTVLTNAVGSHAYKPYIFTLSLKKKKGFLGLGSEIQCFTFVFFDTAGEDLNELDTMSTVNKYICKSAGIIFLLDPMKIPAVSGQVDSSILAGASNTTVIAQADDIMGRVSQLIRNDRNMKETQKIDIPVAAVFSKFDAIESLVPPGATVLEPSAHCAEKAFLMSDWHNVNQEIQGLLAEWGEEAFMAQLDVNYDKYSFFTASALGLNNNPRNGGFEMPRPHRIEDALLWILKENGVIKPKK